MKYFIIFISIFLTSCSIAPELIPSNRKDSPMTLKLKDGIEEPGVKNNDYSWLFWYVPITAVVLLWAKREFNKNQNRSQNDK